MRLLRTYLADERDAANIRQGTGLTAIIPLHQAGISQETIRSLDGGIEEYLMKRFSGLTVKLLSGHRTIAKGEVTGASTNRNQIRLNYIITEVYRK